MRFSLASLISALAATAAALPSKEPKKYISKNTKQPEELKKFRFGPPVVVSLPDGKPVPTETAALKKRDGNWLYCRAYQTGWHIQNFHYYIDTWGNWDDDWGSNYLYQLRKHCPANIEQWGFWYDGGWYLNGGHAEFYEASYNIQCVLDAAWEASEPTGAIWGATCEVYYIV